METYIVTCIAGLESFVAERLQSAKVRIVRSESGLVEFASDLGWKRFQNIRYVSNCFLVLSTGEVGRAKDGVSAALTASFPITKSIKEIIAGKKTFAVVTALENETVRPREAHEAELRFARVLRLRAVATAPSVELWAIVRESGRWYTCIRLTSVRKENKVREAGALRSDITNIMALLSHPRPTDVVYDPFCGTGSLLFERGYAAPYQTMYAGDSDAAMVERAEERLAQLKNVYAKIEDATLSTLANDSVSTIITDPPWGSFKKLDDPSLFYEGMLTEFARVVKPKGFVVMLTGAKDIMGELLAGRFAQTFVLEKRFDILYSGKKSALFVLQKPF